MSRVGKHCITNCGIVGVITHEHKGTIYVRPTKWTKGYQNSCLVYNGDGSLILNENDIRLLD